MLLLRAEGRTGGCPVRFIGCELLYLHFLSSHFCIDRVRELDEQYCESLKIVISTLLILSFLGLKLRRDFEFLSSHWYSFFQVSSHFWAINGLAVCFISQPGAIAFDRADNFSGFYSVVAIRVLAIGILASSSRT